MSKKYRHSEPRRYLQSNYLVYLDGRVWSENYNKFLSAAKTGRYSAYNLCINGRRFSITKHRIIAICFIPNPNNFPMVRHLDDNPENNTIKNLCWGTDWDNKQDAKKNGVYKTGNYRKPGEKHSQSRLKESHVYEIRKRFQNGDSSPKIAKDYGISANHAYGIATKRAWRHLP